MILTEEQYSKGFLSFDASIPPGGAIEIWTSTTDGVNDSEQWAGPYIEPSGSVVPLT